MAEPTSSFAPFLSSTVIRLDFIRERNVMRVQAELSPLFVDYFLHLADHGLKYPAAHAGLFKKALAAFALHCAARPRHEHLAWTIGLQAPRLNVFLAGDNEDCLLTGRLFTESVREAATNVFYNEVMSRRGAEKRRSVVGFAGADPFHAAESYYAASEQRPARYFDLGDETYAMLLAHPDCDTAWLQEVTGAEVRGLGENETLVPIEHRTYHWQCGCNQRKILQALAPAARAGMEALFGGAESIQVQCPRCAATHWLNREAMEAHLARTKDDEE